MPAGYQDLFLEQGTTFTTSMTLEDSYGLPYNLNEFTVKSYAKRSYYSSNTTLQFDSTILDANNGIIQLAADAPTTANIPSGKLVYDVILTQTSSGNVTRVLEGQIIVSPSVTR